MGNWNENQIKDAIVKGHKDGMCDKNGNTIRYRDGRLPNSETGKGDTFRPVDKQKYDKSFVTVFGEKLLNLWPRDKDGQLIGDN